MPGQPLKIVQEVEFSTLSGL